MRGAALIINRDGTMGALVLHMGILECNSMPVTPAAFIANNWCRLPENVEAPPRVHPYEAERRGATRSAPSSPVAASGNSGVRRRLGDQVSRAKRSASAPAVVLQTPSPHGLRRQAGVEDLRQEERHRLCRSASAEHFWRPADGSGEIINDDCRAILPSQTGNKKANPADKELAQSLRRRMLLRLPFEQSRILAQLGGTPHSSTRLQQLRRIPGAGYLAHQYGLVTAVATRGGSDDRRLKLLHPDSSAYHRYQSSIGFSGYCYELYCDHISIGSGDCLEPPAAAPMSHVLFANSLDAAERVVNFFSGQEPQLDNKHVVRIAEIASGLVAIELDQDIGKETVGKVQQGLIFHGATPSLHRVVALHARRPRDARGVTGIDNLTLAEELFDVHLADAMKVLRDIPSRHPLAALARTTLSVLSGLRSALTAARVHHQEVKHSPLVKDALHNLANVARALPGLLEDAESFSSAYDVLMEELYLILASVRPYSEQDYKNAARAQLARRTGNLVQHFPDPTTYLMSSGMGAISGALTVAKSFLGRKAEVELLSFHPPCPDPLYFEISLLASEDGDRKDTRIVITTMNPNAPARRGSGDSVRNWDTAKLISKIRDILAAKPGDDKAPLILILDRTIERKGPNGKSDLADVIGALKDRIESGQLILFLCRSCQKYQGLGTAKIMAGEVSVIAAPGEFADACRLRFRQSETELDWFRNDECQLLAHFLAHAPDDELELMERAARNAAFVHRHCFDFDNFEPGLPFGLIDVGMLPDGRQPQITVKADAVEGGVTLQEVLQLLLPWLDGFGFSRTTWDRLDSGKCRIKAGQESRDDLVEKLYAVGWVKRQDHAVTLDNVLTHMNAVASEGARIVLAKAEVGKWAQTALQILVARRRHDVVLAECKTLFDMLFRFPPYASVLREKLVCALEECRGGMSLKESIMIIGAAFAPVVPNEMLRQNNASLMQLGARRSPQTLQAPADDAANELHDQYFDSRYALSKLASMLALLSALFPRISASDGRKLLQTYREVFDSGLRGFSGNARRHIVERTLSLSRILDGSNGIASDRWADELLHAAHMVDDVLDKARLLLDLEDWHFACFKDSARTKLVEALLLPLGAGSYKACLTKLLGEGKYCLARVSMDTVLDHLHRALNGHTEILLPVDLTDTPVHVNEGGAAMSTADLHDRISEIEMLKSGLPW